MHTKVTSWFVVLLLTAACGAAGGSASEGERGLRVEGRVQQPEEWTIEELENLPLQTAEAAYISKGGEQRHREEGVLLLDLLERSKPDFDPDDKNDGLGHAILVRAGDDFEAVVAWGEIDPRFAHKPILVSVKEDGKRLERPRLVVPGDKHGGRHVRD
ncbi:MAG: hypothetical protein ACRDY7_07690, partial [Acidimicrobiia bacterium]